MFDLGQRETLCKVHRLTLERADKKLVHIEVLEVLQSDHRENFSGYVVTKNGDPIHKFSGGGQTFDEAVNKILERLKGIAYGAIYPREASGVIG